MIPMTGTTIFICIIINDKAYSEYSYTQLISGGQTFGTVETNEGGSVNLSYKDGIGVYLNGDEQKRAVISYDLPDVIQLPVSKGQKVGTAKAEIDGIEIGECDIISEDNAEPAFGGFTGILYNTLCIWLSAY